MNSRAFVSATKYSIKWFCLNLLRRSLYITVVTTPILGYLGQTFAKYREDLKINKNYSKEDRKQYLEGLIDRIKARLNKETNEHELDIIFKMGLVGDGI